MAEDSARLPRRPWWLPLLTIVAGSAAFVWLSVEDTGWWVIGFGVAIALLAGLHGLTRLKARRFPLRLPWAALAGGLIGAGSALATAGLMLLKTGLHNHVFPDFPLAVILGILERLPAWSAAGALCGAGCVFIWGRSQDHL